MSAVTERLKAASLPLLPKGAPSSVLVEDGLKRFTNAKSLHPIILYVVVQEVLEHLEDAKVVKSGACIRQSCDRLR